MTMSPENIGNYMANNNDGNNLNANPILSFASGLFEAVAPGALDDPERAFRELVPKLRYLVIARIEKPTMAQLEALRSFSELRANNLLRVRKAMPARERRPLTQTAACWQGPEHGSIGFRGNN